MPTDPLIGRKLQRRYRVVALIARGGMGNVYRAHDEHLQAEVAIKRVPFRDDLHPEDAQYEGQLLRPLAHPNLPKMYDVFEDKQALYLVMEYIAGQTLKQMISGRGQGLPLEQAANYTVSILKVLDYLHGLTPPIIHRDIKPDNIKFQADGRPIVVDFGIAKTLEPDEHTRLAARGLTPGYGPPEQYRGGTDKRSDVFGAGAVLYFLLTGCSPPDAMERAYNRDLYRLDPRTVDPAIPSTVADVVASATALVMEERYASAGDMLLALRGALEGVTATTLFPTPFPRAPSGATAVVMREPPRSWGKTTLIGSVIGLVGVLLLLFSVQVRLSADGAADARLTVSASATTRLVQALGDSGAAPVTPTPTRVAVTTTVAVAVERATRVATPSHTRTPVLQVSAGGQSIVARTPTFTATPSSTPTATPSSTASPTFTPTPAVDASGNSVILAFESCGTWQRGDETWGTFQCSSTRSTSGVSAGELRYDFTAVDAERDYVVFQQRHPIPGQPRSLGLMVYGDGSGHFLNLWIRDHDGQVWQMPLGTVSHTGWREMHGAFSTNQAWPWTSVSGPDDGAITFPVELEALILDGHPERLQRSGVIYVDDLVARSESAIPVFGGGSEATGATVTPAAVSSPGAVASVVVVPAATATVPSLPSSTPVPTALPTPTLGVATRPPIVVNDIPPWSQISMNDLITLSWSGGGGILGAGDSAYIRVFREGSFYRNLTIPPKEWEQGFFPVRGYDITSSPDVFGRFTLMLEIVNPQGVSLAQSQTFDIEVGP